MGTIDWDGEAFETQRPLLLSIACRMLGSATEAEDVVQDAWLRAVMMSVPMALFARIS